MKPMKRRPSLYSQYSRSTSSLQTLPKNFQQRLSDKPFEYEDIINDKSTSVQPYKLTDILARESDVTISTQISPLTEYKGYSLYLLVTIFHLVWLLWTFLPKIVLNKIGIYYYPSRYWSICSSCVILMLMLYIYIALLFWNIEYETPNLNELKTIIDKDGIIEKNIDKYGWEVTNGVFDLRITDVNNTLYDSKND